MKSGLAGKVQTVLGPVAPGDLGVTMPMEHVLTGVSLADEPPLEASAREIYFATLSPEVLAYVRYYGFRNLEDLRLGDVPTAISEVNLYKQWGGGTLVDIALAESGRDPIGLARISRSTGVKLVMSAGWGAVSLHEEPPLEEDLAAVVAKEILEGVGETGIKAGLLGPVKIGAATTKAELTVIRAAGSVQKKTGAPLMLSPVSVDSSPLVALDVLAEVGADPTHVMVAHFGRLPRSVMSGVMNAGSYGLFTDFGRDPGWHTDGLAIRSRCEAEQIEDIEWLIAQGFIDRILVSPGIHSRHSYFKFGGHGYFFIMGSIVPRLKARGLTQEDADRIILTNPSAVLAFGEPKYR